MKKRINVTQSLIPNREQFHAYVDQILDSGWLTNRGQCVHELEEKLKTYLGVKNIVLTCNATLALQVAYKALALDGEVITSPFTFIATASSAKWGGLDVAFADIDSQTLNIDIQKIEQAITDKTSAIVPVHVFGNPCDVEAIDSLAKKHGLKVIYDAAHAFGVRYKDESILNHGDISILSFHATKLFHTIEGGALIINDDTLCEKVRKMINFGFTGPESIECLGINAKMNEFQAAMGLCLLDDMDDVIMRRQEIIELYNAKFANCDITKPAWMNQSSNNYAYYPIILKDEVTTKKVQQVLNDNNIFPRRYFYPSLNTLNFLSENQHTPISQDIASRILCLPLYMGLDGSELEKISDIILKRIDGTV